MSVQELVRQFALRLCDLSADDFGGAERAFQALSEGRKVKSPSDRVRAEFAMFAQDMRLSLEERDALRKEVFGE